ncbi:peptidylprolyl isomerase [Erythrobacter sp. EC-HK427]|uniref:peptidylprolyl isomerase n=1 Tax=Erythrobacter sp. EC-HK427 TaxID=2038396 RepID=UPI001258D952|nr:peptidylprolyl isomerase [Erythrobacter sp. EC-HK427]VVT16599.1 Peptidylprolyl isomerase [Erythrobacter sp. EC-HK427]
MISFFRNFFQSKIGIGVTLGFLALIALAFASSDVANTGMFGGVAGGDRVAVVGERTISTGDLSQNVSNAFEQARAQNPTLSLEAFIEQGGFDDVLEQVLSRNALAEFAQLMGLRAGSNLVNSEIISGGGFTGLDGEFDAEAFRAMLRQRGLTEATVRDDLALSLLARQTVVPISYQARMPLGMARTYAQLLNETRSGSAAVFPANLFAPEGDPTDAQISAFYAENRASYIRPERRTLRYAAFGAEQVAADLPPVTAAQIAARYEADSVLYQASERRSFTQLVLQSEADARAVLEQAEGGMNLQQIAQRRGLATTSVEDVEQADFAATASQAVANAAYAADQGAFAGPVQGSLGWYVLSVDNVTQIAGRSLAQASEEIRETLMQERVQQALEDVSERLETEFARGKTLEQAAEELGIELSTTPQLLADGRVYGQPAQAPQQLARVVSFAFEIDEGDPEIAELVPGEAFLIFDVDSIVRSAAPPIAELRPQLIEAWRREQGLAAAGEAAARVLARVEGGMSLAQAVAAEEVDVPAVQSINLNRRELAEQERITRATILFFSMAEGTTERVAVPEAGNWYVVQLDNIETPELALDSEDVANTAAQLSQVIGDEYLQQFINGAERSVAIERNDAGIDAVRTGLISR